MENKQTAEEILAQFGGKQPTNQNKEQLARAKKNWANKDRSLKQRLAEIESQLKIQRESIPEQDRGWLTLARKFADGDPKTKAQVAEVNKMFHPFYNVSARQLGTTYDELQRAKEDYFNMEQAIVKSKTNEFSIDKLYQQLLT